MEFNINDFIDSEEDLNNKSKEETTESKSFSASDFGLEEPKTQEESAVENDEIYNKETESLDLSYNNKLKLLDELDLDDEQREALKKNLEVKMLKNKEQAKQESFDRYIKEDKKAPVPEEYKDNTLNKTWDSQVRDFMKSVNQPFDAGVELAMHTAQVAGNAIGATFEKGINTATAGMSILDFYESQRERIVARGEELNKKLDPEGKLALKPTKMTELFSSIVIPFKVTDPKKMLMLEGMMGYMFKYNESGDFYDSLRSFAINASLAGSGKMVADGIINLISKKGTDNALNYLWEKHSQELIESTGKTNGSKEQIIAEIEQDWLKIMGGEGDSTTKVKAMIDRLGGQGAAYKQAAQQKAGIAEEVIVREPKAQRVEALRTGAKEGSIEKGAEALVKQVGMDSDAARLVATTPEELQKMTKGKISETYGQFQDAVKAKYFETIEVDEKLISNMTEGLERNARLGGRLTSAERNLANTLRPNMKLSDILSANRDINDLIRNSSGTQLHNATQLKNRFDAVIKDSFDEADYTMFRNIEAEYAKKSALVGKSATNKLSANLLDFANKRKTIDSVKESLKALDAGEVTFKQIEDVIGTANTAKVEQGILKSFFEKNIDDIEYDVISKQINNMEFVTKEGKELKQAINNMNKIFSADSFTNINRKISQESDTTVQALTDNLMTKMKYTLMSRIWKKITQGMDYTKSRIESRHINEITDILTTKRAGGTIDIFGKNVPVGEVREIARDAILDTYKTHIKTMNIQGQERKAELVREAERQLAEQEAARVAAERRVQENPNLRINESGNEVYHVSPALSLDETMEEIERIAGANGTVRVQNPDGGTTRLRTNDDGILWTSYEDRLREIHQSVTDRITQRRASNTQPSGQATYKSTQEITHFINNDSSPFRAQVVDSNSFYLIGENNVRYSVSKTNRNSNVFDNINAMDSNNGAGAGSKMYFKLWDVLGQTGNRYKPSNSLTSINKVRMTANMLKYASKNGGKAEHLILNRVQHGVGDRLNNQPLTQENAKKLVDGFRRWINDNALSGEANLTARTTDERLKELGERLGGNSRYRLGFKTLKLLRDFFRNGRTLSMSAAIMASLLNQEDFIRFLEEKGV